MYANSALLFLLEEVRKEIATARVLLCEKFKKENAEKVREKTGNEVAEKTPLSNWVMLRLGLHLRAMPYLTTAGFLKSAMNNFMEAQVDGYLCRRIPDDFSNAPLAICEAMPCVKTDRYDANLRQETVEMACWIAERHGNKRDGFLQSCAGGAKRRLMISQDRHEIYIIIGEYGSKYGEYITGNAAWLAKAPLPLPLDKFDLEENRKAARGSASYNEQAKVMGVENVRLSHMVRGDEKKPASGSRALRSQHPRVLLSADEFLIMHQFGPVITSRADNMERPVRRLVGLCYSLTQTQNTTATAFVFSPQFFSNAHFLQGSTLTHSMADPMLTSLCAICHIAAPKYKCPRCGMRSCSLACIKKHKAWSECSGARDPTTYLPPSRLRTPAGVDHDYNFLHGIERSLERTERVLVDERRLVQPEELRPMTMQEVRWKTGRDGRKRKVLVTRLLREAKGRNFERFLAQKLRKLNIEVICVPTGMTRQKENNTTLNRRTSRINWQVEWFVMTDAGAQTQDEGRTATNATRFLSKVMDNIPLHEAYRTMLDEQQAAKRRQAKKEGRATEEQTLYYGSCPESRCWPSPTTMQDPQTGLWFACTGPGIDLWPHEKQREYQFFLARPQTRRPDQRTTVSPLQTSDCFRDALANTRVLEFPAIVVLRSGQPLPETYILGPKDTVSPAAAAPGTIGTKRKDGPADAKSGGDKAAKKRKSEDVEEGEVNEDDNEDSDGVVGGLLEGDVIAEQSMGEDDDDDDTSSAGTSSESENEMVE